MIELPGDVQIMDAKHLICTLDDGASISMELMVATGKGYIPASANRPEDAPIGLIPVDLVFSPVKRVSYKIENSRVGQVTDYDKLSMTVETNGTTAPADAVALAHVETSATGLVTEVSSARLPMRHEHHGRRRRMSAIVPRISSRTSVTGYARYVSPTMTRSPRGSSSLISSRRPTGLRGAGPVRRQRALD